MHVSFPRLRHAAVVDHPTDPLCRKTRDDDLVLERAAAECLVDRAVIAEVHVHERAGLVEGEVLRIVLLLMVVPDDCCDGGRRGEEGAAGGRDGAGGVRTVRRYMQRAQGGCTAALVERKVGCPWRLCVGKVLGSPGQDQEDPRMTPAALRDHQMKCWNAFSGAHFTGTQALKHLEQMWSHTGEIR